MLKAQPAYAGIDSALFKEPAARRTVSIASALLLLAVVVPAAPAAQAAAPPSAALLLEQELPAWQRAAWRKVIRWPAACEEDFRSTVGDRKSGLVFHDLGNGHRLAQITCAPGAYQGYYLFADVTGFRQGIRSRLLSFPLFSSPDGKKVERREGEEVWGTVTFDARSRSLSVLNRFRGTGDCGTYVVYRFPKGAPVIDRAFGKSQCDGRAEPPQRWPRID